LQADTGSSGTTSTNKIAYQLQINDAPEENDAAEDGTVITMAEVQRHHLAQDAWVVVDGRVYESVGTGVSLPS
jgi:cytochrome b involved in lipid metabolism